MNEAQLVSRIYQFVVSQGTLKNEAKSCWGATIFEFENIWASLEDDGFTQRIEADGFSIDVRNVCGRINYEQGSKVNLERLYKSIFEE